MRSGNTWATRSTRQGSTSTRAATPPSTLTNPPSRRSLSVSLSLYLSLSLSLSLTVSLCLSGCPGLYSLCLALSLSRARALSLFSGSPRLYRACRQGLSAQNGVCSAATEFPRQSRRRGRQKSISPQGSVLQQWKQAQVPVLNQFTPTNTLAWFRLSGGRASFCAESSVPGCRV